MFICALPLHAVFRVSCKRIMHQTQIGHQVANNICFLQGICCLFFAQNSPLLFSKKQATDTLIKNQNPRNPNKRVGLKGE